jgi:hypothetical protein
MKIVEFIKNDLPYCQGDVAGFKDHIADKLIGKGFVKLHGSGQPKNVGERIPEPLEFGYAKPAREPGKGAGASA